MTTDPADRIADNVLGQEVMGDFRPSDLLATAGSVATRALRQPTVLAQSALGLVSEWGLVAAGQSRREPPAGDRRFKDPAWHQNPAYAALLQGYLATRDALARYAEQSTDDARQADRSTFLFAQLADALAPTNFLLGNPAALRRFRSTRGRSLLDGARQLFADVADRRPVPSQVDRSAFRVGGNLASTPGSVVLRTEMFELIQYAPQTQRVRQRPILIVPSIVNKFYVFDLAPDRSVIEHFVRNEITVFTIAWRNPQPRHDRWGMPEYQDAVDAAIDAATDICQVDSVNLWAVCGAGPVAVATAGHHAATGERRVNSLVLVVSPLDTDAMSNAPSIGAFVDHESPQPMAETLRNKRMSAREFTLLFAMLRANELIWHYWVNNYLMGNRPTAFDVLYWNDDGTGMTAQFNHDFSAFVRDNPFVRTGGMTVSGTPIADLSALGFDSYVLGAKNDHLCVWQGVYRSAQLLAPRSRFVLGNSGHIQTIVCPPGNPKASFSTYDDLSVGPDEWLAASTRHPGSWWDDCVGWTTEHAGDLVAAPAEPGSTTFPVICPAPGTYVHERA